VDLPASEFRLLEHLARSPTHVFSRSDLMSLLDDSVGTDRVVDAHIGGIRRKLRDGGGVDIVETVRGVGYRLWPPSKGS
jgi:two-component system response regulator AdeR